jgi:hypothetical protein
VSIGVNMLFLLSLVDFPVETVVWTAQTPVLVEGTRVTIVVALPFSSVVTKLEATDNTFVLDTLAVSVNEFAEESPDADFEAADTPDCAVVCGIAVCWFEDEGTVVSSSAALEGAAVVGLGVVTGTEDAGFTLETTAVVAIVCGALLRIAEEVEFADEVEFPAWFAMAFARSTALRCCAFDECGKRCIPSSVRPTSPIAMSKTAKRV